MSLEERFKYLAKLKPGWLDGEGEKVSEQALARARELVTPLDRLSPARLFPTPEGNVQAEWTFLDNPDAMWAVDVEIKPEAAYGYATCLSGRSSEAEEIEGRFETVAEAVAWFKTVLVKARPSGVDNS